jgi:N-hydroxyarylamine O-acetyltransferase
VSPDDSPLPQRLVARVLERLGLQGPPGPDLAGLSDLYGAWCLHVPFDNTRKMIALRAGGEGPLPGASAEDFLEHWLAGGTGGTCWPSSNALYAVLCATGFRSRRVIGSMRDQGVANHASVKVCLDDGRHWLVDSSMLVNRPLPLGQEAFVGDDPVWPAEVEAVDGTHLVWWHAPPGGAYLPCRLLVDPASFQDYLAGYDRSRERSPFNQRLYARRNQPGRLVILVGRTRYTRTRDGIATRDLDADELQASLRTDIGLSEDAIARWAASGSLEDSLVPPSPGTAPPHEDRLPPSKRRP